MEISPTGTTPVFEIALKAQCDALVQAQAQDSNNVNFPDVSSEVGEALVSEGQKKKAEDQRIREEAKKKDKEEKVGLKAKAN